MKVIGSIRAVNKPRPTGQKGVTTMNKLVALLKDLPATGVFKLQYHSVKRSLKKSRITGQPTPSAYTEITVWYEQVINLSRVDYKKLVEAGKLSVENKDAALGKKERKQEPWHMPAYAGNPFLHVHKKDKAAGEEDRKYYLMFYKLGNTQIFPPKFLRAVDKDGNELDENKTAAIKAEYGAKAGVASNVFTKKVDEIDYLQHGDKVIYGKMLVTN